MPCAPFSTGVTRYFVYWTYGKIWLPIFLTMTVAAWVVYRRRRPMGAERLAWRILLAAYAVATISVAGDYYTPWTDVFFVIGLVPMLVIGLVGVWLGILMLRHGFRPRVTPWALILFIPGFFAITEVTSMGSVILPDAVGLGLRAARQCADRRRRGAGGGSHGGGDGDAAGVSQPREGRPGSSTPTRASRTCHYASAFPMRR